MIVRLERQPDRSSRAQAGGYHMGPRAKIIHIKCCWLTPGSISLRRVRAKLSISRAHSNFLSRETRFLL